MSLEKLQLTGLVAAFSVAPVVFASIGQAQARAIRQPAESRSIRPFTVQVPQAELDELRRRIAATR